MVIISKNQIPKCSRILIAQLKICGNRNITVNSNYEPMVYNKNIKQLCVIESLDESDLEIVRKTLNKPIDPQSTPIIEEWPKDMLSSRRDIKDFVENKPGLGLEEAIKRNQRTSLRFFKKDFDYKKKQSVNLIFNKSKVRNLIKKSNKKETKNCF
jgi:hypothetical protein